MFPNAKNIAFTQNHDANESKEANKQKNNMMPLNRLVCGMQTCADGVDGVQTCAGEIANNVNKNICVWLPSNGRRC